VSAAENATLMIHNPAGLVAGESRDMQEMAALLDKLRGPLANVYADKTGKSQEAVIAAMDATTWFTAQEAKDWGLVDEVTAPLKIAANFDLSKFKSRARPSTEEVFARQFRKRADGRWDFIPPGAKSTAPIASPVATGQRLSTEEIWARQFTKKPNINNSAGQRLSMEEVFARQFPSKTSA